MIQPIDTLNEFKLFKESRKFTITGHGIQRQFSTLTMYSRPFNRDRGADFQVGGGLMRTR